jgi:hypothetical protein
MTALLEVETLRKQASDKAKFITLLVEKAESLGILVFRNGVVGRFAIYDTYAPAIFVNTNDAKSALRETCSPSTTISIYTTFPKSGMVGHDFKKPSQA